MKALPALAFMVCALRAQVPVEPVLENTGKPMRVEYRCTADDILWSGMSCSEDDPCAVYLELAAVESVGNRIFLAGNIHADSMTLYSILLGSDDAGKTWREAFPRIRGAGLDHIQFADFETGWVSGQSLFPLPRDAFFLLTEDGGKTWRNRPVFGESRGGSILQFSFASRRDGSLVIDRGPGEADRYELYESPNSGETWMVRATSRNPIPIKGARSSGAGWRIRADGPTRSFALERRQAERWSAIASFAVPIGACKPPAQPASERPAEPESEAPPLRPPPSLKR